MPFQPRPQPDTTSPLIEAIDAQLDWHRLFPDDHPRELEIGSGKGLFLLNAGQSRPNVNFVGIELARKYARNAADRVAKRGLTNVRVVWGDAKALIARAIPDHSVQAIHVYFPDPWWKKRHRKRRMFQPGFVALAARLLIPGGRLEIATDVESYHEEILDLLRSSPAFLEIPVDPVADPQHDLDYRTHFERKYRIEGRPIFRSRFAAKSFATPEEADKCPVLPATDDSTAD